MIWGLQTASPAPNSLEQAFSSLLHEITPCQGVSLRIFVEGRARALNPAIQEQLFLIGREAVMNALRHSTATKIEVEVQYLRDFLCLFVQDNGCGINPDEIRFVLSVQFDGEKPDKMKDYPAPPSRTRTNFTGKATNQDLSRFLYNCAHCCAPNGISYLGLASMHRNISVSRHVSLLLALAFSFVQPSLAGIRPSFSLDYCSWHATDIVLVEVTLIPGTFRVMESWKGDLKAGNLVTVPELQPPTGALEIVAYPKELADILKGGLDEQVPAQRVGSRMVLFLKKAPEASNDHWKPADLFGEMKTSAVWTDGGQLYAFRQLVNPLPSVLVPWDMSLDRMKGRVREIRRVQLELVKVTAIEDGAARAEGLKLYVSSDVLEAQHLALSELGKGGSKALATIREMLSDPAFANEGAELVEAIAKAGGESVGEELDMRLQEQLRFWQATGPTLSLGWWNQDPSPHAPLRDRYLQTLELVRALQRVHYRPASITAEQLGNFWRSLQQLNDPSGLNQMVTECDQLVDNLRAN